MIRLTTMMAWGKPNETESTDEPMKEAFGSKEVRLGKKGNFVLYKVGSGPADLHYRLEDTKRNKEYIFQPVEIEFAAELMQKAR